MPFSDTTFAKGAFKRLNALAHTANARDPANESILSQAIIQAAKATAAEAIANSQATAVAAGIVEVVTFDLTEVSGSNNLAFEAKFPSGYTGHFGGGAAGNLLRPYSWAIPKTFSSPILDVDSDGYNPILKNVTPVVIAAGDPCDWLWDETSGVVTCEDDAASGTDWPPATIKCCIYTGDTIQAVLNIVARLAAVVAANRIVVGSDGARGLKQAPVTFPAADGSDGQRLVTNGGGALSFQEQVHINTTAPTDPTKVPLWLDTTGF
jgi:hypothetical protein